MTIIAEAATVPVARIASKATLAAIRPTFDLLSRDPYCAGGYRYRAASRFDCTDGLRPLPRLPLYQSAEYNPIEGYGGIARHYDDLPAPLLRSSALEVLAAEWVALIGSPVATLSVHMIRTRAPGMPVPEGKHRDGNDWVGIYVAARRNITEESGVTTVWDRRDRVLLHDVLRPGELASFDDRLTFHDTSPVAAAEAGEPAWRDVLVFSTPDHAHYLDGGA